MAGKKVSDYIKGLKFISQLSDYQLLKIYSAAQAWLSTLSDNPIYLTNNILSGFEPWPRTPAILRFSGFSLVLIGKFDHDRFLSHIISTIIHKSPVTDAE